LKSTALVVVRPIVIAFSMYKKDVDEPVSQL